MQLEVLNVQMSQLPTDSLQAGVRLLIDLRIDGFDPPVIVGIKTIAPGAANMSSSGT